MNDMVTVIVTEVVKHLTGQHDQSSHGGAGHEESGTFADKKGAKKFEKEMSAKDATMVDKEVARTGAELASKGRRAWNEVEGLMSVTNQLENAYREKPLSPSPRNKKKAAERKAKLVGYKAKEETALKAARAIDDEAKTYEKKNGISIVAAWEAHTGRRWPYYQVESAAGTPSAPLYYTKPELKHLPGRHNQDDHAGKIFEHVSAALSPTGPAGKLNVDEHVVEALKELELLKQTAKPGVEINRHAVLDIASFALKTIAVKKGSEHQKRAKLQNWQEEYMEDINEAAYQIDSESESLSTKMPKYENKPTTAAGGFSVGNRVKTQGGVNGKIVQFSQDDPDTIWAHVQQDANHTPVMVDVAELRMSKPKKPVHKHLPGKHDQMEHGKEIRGGLAKAPTNWRTAKKMRDSLVVQLGQLAKAGLPAELKKQILDHAALLQKPGAVNNLPKLTPQMALAFKLSKKADAYLLGQKQKKVLPAERLKETTPVGEPQAARRLKEEVGGEVKKPAVGAGGSDRLKKLAAAKAPEPKSAEAPKAGPKKDIDYHAKANTWLNAIKHKVAEVAFALRSFGTRWINSKIRNAQQRAELKKYYGKWSTNQINADKLYGQMRVEAQKAKGQKIPTRKFYELAREWKKIQNLAEYNKQVFYTRAKIPAEAQKSMVDSLPELISPYEE